MAFQRHTKIKGAANPFDPQWEVYFEARRGVKLADDLKERRKRLSLWKAPGGSCPICEQPITPLTGWPNHHIVWGVPGGTDRADNRVRLQPNCHTHVHRQGLTVVNPRPSRGD